MQGEEEVQPPHDWPTTLEEGWLKGYYITNSLDELERGLYKDVGKEAIWTLSSARAGEAVDELMSDDVCVHSARASRSLFLTAH